jgi:hypothetical protein
MENLTDTKPPEKKKPAGTPQPQPPAKAEAMAVRVIQFDATKPIGLPGKFATSLTAAGPDAATNREHHTIWYLPWMRHFQVTYNKPGEKPRTVFVHESYVVQWEPV